MYWTTDKATGFLLVTMAIIFFWFGGLKFTPEMTEAVQLFLRNNFLTAWLYGIFSAKTVSYLFGVAEILIGAALLGGIANATVGRYAALASVVTYLVTFMFLFTTPGVVPEGATFPKISGMPGAFLLKDIALLSGSIVLYEHFTVRAAKGS